MQIFPNLIEFAAASLEDLRTFIAATQAAVTAVAANPGEYVTDEFTVDQLFEATSAAVASLEPARAALADLEATAAAPVPVDEETVADFAALAAEALETPDAPEGDEPEPEEEPEAALALVPDPDPEVVEPEAEPVVAAARRVAPAPIARPSRSRQPVPVAEPTGNLAVTLTAAATGLGPEVGEQIDALEVARMMIERRRRFGNIAEGSTEDVVIARFGWDYPAERHLGKDEIANMALVAAAVRETEIQAEMDRRRRGSLVAAGGLCAPLTPYYDLANVSTAARPVRDSLPGFNADRGGIRYARPPLLTVIDTAVGRITAANDALGGTFATKACQVVECPPFQDTVIAAIYHCLQIGNLPARTFPELLATYNNYVLAAQARLADSQLLTDIDAFSTNVTAASSGLGAVGDLFAQILAAAVGMRSRHRMAENTVLRLMLPSWAIPLMVSDVLRSQFERFDTDSARIIAKLREFNVEPTFYVDGAAGAAQVFGVQPDGSLLEFPPTVRWYLFPEGSFLFLDGGTLEIGLVRDSILNSTNDYQLFGETFENVAFVGVESLAVTSTTCDSGIVAGPKAIATCPSW